MFKVAFVNPKDLACNAKCQVYLSNNTLHFTIKIHLNEEELPGLIASHFLRVIFSQIKLVQ